MFPIPVCNCSSEPLKQYFRCSVIFSPTQQSLVYSRTTFFSRAEYLSLTLTADAKDIQKHSSPASSTSYRVCESLMFCHLYLIVVSCQQIVPPLMLITLFLSNARSLRMKFYCSEFFSPIDLSVKAVCYRYLPSVRCLLNQSLWVLVLLLGLFVCCLLFFLFVNNPSHPCTNNYFTTGVLYFSWL